MILTRIVPPLLILCILILAGCHPAPVYQIQSGRLDDWQSFGGSWEMENHAIHNNSDDRGAKLLTGSPQWSDYTLQTDLRFDGNHGDMGVIIRSNREEEGVDAYSGYYVGLRTVDGTLIAGRSDYGWTEGRPIAMPGGVYASAWYRLTVTAVGCGIAASSENLTTHQTAWLNFQDTNCVRTGRMGLRSLATGGTWRNLSVRASSLADYSELATHAGFLEHPEFPRREADYNRFFRFSPPEPDTARIEQPAARPAATPELTRTHPGDLQDLPRTGRTLVTVRGAVTLTSPAFYIQDATTGVLVQNESTHLPAVNVGDTVEVTGVAQSGLYSPTITQATVRPLWSGGPMPPLAVTAAQASSGAYSGRFIEIEGRLTGMSVNSSGYQILNIENAGQSFLALYKRQPGKLIQALQQNSIVRLRGICVLSPAYARELVPFALLLRSQEDIQILAGPPWWTPSHIIIVFAATLALALLAQVLYFSILRWKTLTITQERERLAHEIHDTMAQSFAGVGYQIQGIRSSVLRGEGNDTARIADQLSVAYQLVRRCHEEASSTIAMMASSSASEADNLLSDLQKTAQRISAGQVETYTEVAGTPFELNLRLANALLHVGQEAITNSLRHAGATGIRLILAFSRDKVRLTVADNGIGFEFTSESTGFGIQGMQKRAREIDAEFLIRTSPGMGTQVTMIATLRHYNPFYRLWFPARRA